MAKIVIAEDDIVSRKIMVAVVESMGHMVIQCSDGLRAFYVLQDNPDTQMLITDVEMPNLSGHELIEKVRECDRFNDIPILIVSGAVGPRAINDLLAAGASAFLGKPLNGHLLQEAITQNLNA